MTPSVAKVREQIVMRGPGELKPAARNPRTHSRKQIDQIAASIERFGFTNPVLVDNDLRIMAGHGRVAAARQLGLDAVPTLCLGDLSPEERKAYALADNKLALNAGWDQELLALELQELIASDFEVELTGFSLAEIDLTLDAAAQSAVEGNDEPADQVPLIADQAVSRTGDGWLLGRHRLICGDARVLQDFQSLMQGEGAHIVFTDPPYNVPIDGHVCGKGQVRHREFAMGAGEMSPSEFVRFLSGTLGLALQHIRSGTILYVCMDWRHMRELCECPSSGHLAQAEC